MPLPEFMEALEKIAQLILETTCNPRLPGIHLDVRRQPRGFHFEMTRGRSVLIKVRTNQGEKVLSCKVKGMGSRRVESLGDLRCCICAHLVPNMRVFNLIQAVMEDRVELEDTGWERGPMKRLALRDGAGLRV